jgi:hypothetical protein
LCKRFTTEDHASAFERARQISANNFAGGARLVGAKIGDTITFEDFGRDGARVGGVGVAKSGGRGSIDAYIAFVAVIGARGQGFRKGDARGGYDEKRTTQSSGGNVINEAEPSQNFRVINEAEPSQNFRHDF